MSAEPNANEPGRPVSNQALLPESEQSGSRDSTMTMTAFWVQDAEWTAWRFGMPAYPKRDGARGWTRSARRLRETAAGYNTRTLGDEGGHRHTVHTGDGGDRAVDTQATPVGALLLVRVTRGPLVSCPAGGSANPSSCHPF